MAHTIIATLKIKDGKLAEALDILKAHAAWIKDNEPGTTHYFVHVINGTNKICVYERYESKDAFNIHGKNLVEKAGALMALIDGGLDIIQLDDA